MSPRKIIQFFVLLFIAHTPLYSDGVSNEKIVLIHGFLGASWNLQYHGHMLKRAHLNVVAWDYSSLDKNIQKHAEDLIGYLKNESNLHPMRPIHFLTHSMGGLVLRAAINHPECPIEAKSGRAVLLVPPNQGSIWGRTLGSWTVVRILCGDKSGRELLTQEDFNYLGEFPASMQIKVIAGDLSFNPFLSQANDGVVTVKETFLNTSFEHAIVQEEHHLILFSKKTSQLITEFFLRT